VCIIEAMKVMNEIKAEISGVIVDVVTANGSAVEYGQVLFKVRPDNHLLFIIFYFLFKKLTPFSPAGQ